MGAGAEPEPGQPHQPQRPHWLGRHVLRRKSPTHGLARTTALACSLIILTTAGSAAASQAHAVSFFIARAAVIGAVAAALIMIIAADGRLPSALVSRAARRGSGDLDAGNPVFQTDLTERAAGRAICMVSRLMPRDAGERWLGEVESFPFEAAPAQRAKAARNYLITTPQVIMTGWVAESARRARRPAASRAAKARGS